MTATLRTFVRESNLIEGITREPTREEMHAHEKLLAYPALTVTIIEEFVQTIQPGAALRRGLGMNVMVGGYIAPEGGVQITADLMSLLETANRYKLQDYETHLAYEKLHPFMDGDGRSGRAIWLWMRGGIAGAPLGFLHHWYYDSLRAA